MIERLYLEKQKEWGTREGLKKDEPVKGKRRKRSDVCRNSLAVAAPPYSKRKEPEHEKEGESTRRPAKKSKERRVSPGSGKGEERRKGETKKKKKVRCARPRLFGALGGKSRRRRGKTGNKGRVEKKGERRATEGRLSRGVPLKGHGRAAKQVRKRRGRPRGRGIR